MARPGSAEGESADDGDATPQAGLSAPPQGSADAPSEEIAAVDVEPVLVECGVPRRKVAIVVAILALVVATGVFAYLSSQNDSVANRYHHLDLAEIALVHRLDQQVAAATARSRT